MRLATDQTTSAGQGRSCAMCRRDRGCRPTRVGTSGVWNQEVGTGGRVQARQVARQKSPGDGKGDEDGRMVAGRRRRGRDVT